MTNEIIETLCTKFGVTSQYLIAEMARYYVASGITKTIAEVFIIAICGVVAFIAYQQMKEIENSNDAYKDTESQCIVLLLCAGVAFALLICLVASIHQVVTFSIAPTGATISKILSQIRG